MPASGTPRKSVQEIGRELVDLTVDYAKQETVDPLKGLARQFGYGLGAAALFGVGSIFVLVGLLRFLQTETDGFFDGNSWASLGAYGIVIVAAVVIVVVGKFAIIKKDQ